MVQFAPFGNGQDRFAEVREAQMAVAKNTPNVATIVTTDVGDFHDIQPIDKAPVGQRLALAARAIAYGEDIEFRGPTLVDAKFNAGAATLTFDHAGEGLKAKGDVPKGFDIAGRNHKFVDADAEITGVNSVVVSSSEVEEPAAVRFAWKDFNEADLWSGSDLPAEPFRTDKPPKAADNR